MNIYLKTIIVFSFIILNGCIGKAQKIQYYLASNGITYKVGDTITLGVGSEPDGAFGFIYSGLAKTIFASIAEENDYDPRLPDFYSGKKVIIRKIRKQGNLELFNFTTDDLGSFILEIENAVKNCEIAYCHPDGFLTQEEFEKLVLLYRAFLSGSLTEEKFHALRNELIGIAN